MEHLLQDRQVDRCGLEQQTNHHRRPEPTVCKQAAGERRPPLGTRVKGVKDLCQGQRHERYRGRLSQALALGPVPKHADAKGEESDPCEQQTLPDDQADKTQGEQRLLRVARGAFHHVRCRRLQRERKGGEDVGNQVEPQDLKGHQRERPADHESEKYR